MSPAKFLLNQANEMVLITLGKPEKKTKFEILNFNHITSFFQQLNTKNRKMETLKIVGIGSHKRSRRLRPNIL